jgi:hypothetical protein
MSYMNVNKTDKMTYFYIYHEMALTLYFLKCQPKKIENYEFQQLHN